MNTQLLDFLKSRRSIRKFQDKQVTQQELDAVLEAGTYAPTAKGGQAPVIVAVQDAATIAQLDRMNAEILGAPRPYYGAPTILLVFAPEEWRCAVEDGSAVITTLLLAAHAAGLGAVWINREREMFDSGEGKALLKRWGLPESLRGIGGIALGYAGCEPPKAAPRKSGYIVKQL